MVFHHESWQIHSERWFFITKDGKYSSKLTFYPFHYLKGAIAREPGVDQKAN